MNLIVQHWCGDFPQWTSMAEQTIRKYAKSINSEYLLLKDYPMMDMVKQKQEKPWLILQKLYVLSQKFDSYDDVLLLDMDMIATKNIDNIFILLTTIYANYNYKEHYMYCCFNAYSSHISICKLVNIC